MLRGTQREWGGDAGRWEGLAKAARFNNRELARMCRISVRQLQRDFRRCIGRTPQEWLDEQRMIAAQRLLKLGLSVKAVAIELGFKQTSHFCRQFKLLNGMTPSNFALTQAGHSPGCRFAITPVAAG